MQAIVNDFFEKIPRRSQPTGNAARPKPSRAIRKTPARVCLRQRHGGYSLVGLGGNRQIEAPLCDLPAYPSTDVATGDNLSTGRFVCHLFRTDGSPSGTLHRIRFKRLPFLSYPCHGQGRLWNGSPQLHSLSSETRWCGLCQSSPQCVCDAIVSQLLDPLKNAIISFGIQKANGFQMLVNDLHHVLVWLAICCV